MTKNGISVLLECLVLLLSQVLLLLVWPGQNEECSKDVLCPHRNLGLCSIAEQLVHGTAFPDVVLERVDKLLGGLQSLHSTNFRLRTYENLDSHGAIIYGQDISIDIICSNGFLMMVHIECGIRRMIVLLKMNSLGQAAHLRHDLEGFC